MHFWLAENKSIFMQHECKVVKQVQITNCTHTFKILSVLTHYDVFSYTWLTSNNMIFFLQFGVSKHL